MTARYAWSSTLPRPPGSRAPGFPCRRAARGASDRQGRGGVHQDPPHRRRQDLHHLQSQGRGADPAVLDYVCYNLVYLKPGRSRAWPRRAPRSCSNCPSIDVNPENNRYRAGFYFYKSGAFAAQFFAYALFATSRSSTRRPQPRLERGVPLARFAHPRPHSRVGGHARRVNDYCYAYTLEQAIKAAETRGDMPGPISAARCSRNSGAGGHHGREPGVPRAGDRGEHGAQGPADRPGAPCAGPRPDAVGLVHRGAAPHHSRDHPVKTGKVNLATEATENTEHLGVKKYNSPQRAQRAQRKNGYGSEKTKKPQSTQRTQSMHGFGNTKAGRQRHAVPFRLIVEKVNTCLPRLSR